MLKTNEINRKKYVKIAIPSLLFHSCEWNIDFVYFIGKCELDNVLIKCNYYYLNIIMITWNVWNILLPLSRNILPSTLSVSFPLFRLDITRARYLRYQLKIYKASEHSSNIFNKMENIILLSNIILNNVNFANLNFYLKNSEDILVEIYWDMCG